MKLASVIVNNSSKKTDREFDYLVPAELDGMLQPGMKVIIPFGMGNKALDGYLTKIKECDEIELATKGFKYKYLIDVFDADGYSFIDQEGMELATFIKETYHSTMNEAIRLMQPPGSALKETTYARLKTEEYGIAGFETIASQLKTDRYIELGQLSDKLGKKLKKAVLHEMQQLGIIELKTQMIQGVNAKTINLIQYVDSESATAFMESPGARNKRQAELLRLIAELESPLQQSELCERLQCSATSIKTLISKGFLKQQQQELTRTPYQSEYRYEKPLLTLNQGKAIESIHSAYETGTRKTLIYGVTGCGKTEIYLSLIEEQLAKGQGAIMLVPEISLTPQTVHRFKGRFGNIVAVLHSRLSDGERYDEWRRIKRGEARVVIGARSAVFAPVKNLKIIIIDEEHEYSYKSEVSPKYVTSEVAEFRVDYNRGMLVLGSATPSVESYFKASTGYYHLVEIEQRVDEKPMPEASIVDMRQELKAGNRSMLSSELYEGIQHNLQSGLQTILFLNRRGYSTFVSCRECGYICKCGNCDVSLTYHLSDNRLSCHYCGIESVPPSICPKCGSKYIKHFGTGTEKIELEIKKMFPKARTIRMDLDTTRKKGSHEQLYNTFKQNEADILIGTQMISKGMDFENVTLVGVISADTSLNLPDFRSAERTFQLITQVAGRAGRGSVNGKVVIQTYEPDNFSIQCASRHDYKSFFNHELAIRRQLGNPPFGDLLHVVFTCEDEQELIRIGMQIKDRCTVFEKHTEMDVLGPTPCHISKIKNQFRWHMVFRGNVAEYYDAISELIQNTVTGSKLQFSMDLNPYSML